ncbi:MAG: hypothetical protein KJ955_06430 [Nanoarchaeota archaeon]|nr:hypothetical protein [Nanoarchaeota archaeon]
MANLAGKTIAALALTAAFGCADFTSDEYLEQEIQNCACKAQIIKETRSTDEWLRLSEYITAGGNTTGAAWEMVEEPDSTQCLEKSIYMFAETPDERAEIRYTDIDCNNSVDTFAYGGAVIPREIFEDSYDSSFLELEAEFDARFGIEKKIEEWHKRKGFKK